MVYALQWFCPVQVFRGEQIPQLFGVHFATLGVGDVLYRLGKFDLHTTRQANTVVGFHNVGNAALAGLRVHTNNGLVGAANILGVDGQVGDFPGDVVNILVSPCGHLVEVVEAFVDGILVGAGEGGKDQVAAVGLAGGDGHLVAVFDGFPDFVDVAEGDLRVHTASQHIEAQSDQVDVAGAFAVAEEAAFNAVGAGHETEFGGGDAGAAVIVGVQGEDGGVPVGEVAAHPFYLVGVHVGGGHFDGGWQVDNDGIIGCGADGFGDGIADVFGEGQFGAGEGFGAVFPAPVSVGVVLGDTADQCGGVGGEFF